MAVAGREISGPGPDRGVVAASHGGRDHPHPHRLRQLVGGDLTPEQPRREVPQRPLAGCRRRAVERGHVVGVLTAASREYAHRVLDVIRLRDAFHPELVMTRDCVGGHYKNCAEPYLAFLARSARIAPGSSGR